MVCRAATWCSPNRQPLNWNFHLRPTVAHRGGYSSPTPPRPVSRISQPRCPIGILPCIRPTLSSCSFRQMVPRKWTSVLLSASSTQELHNEQLHSDLTRCFDRLCGS